MSEEELDLDLDLDLEEPEKLGPISDEVKKGKENCIAKVLRGKHCLVIGATGSGKTWWMSHLADRYLHRFIFVNPNEEEIVEDICTSHYNETSEVIEGILNRETKIEFIPDEDTNTALEQLKELRLGLFQIATDINITSGQFWLNFILDEVQSYAWKGARNDVEVFLTRGRRYGIRSWVISQRPQNVSSTIINNVQNQIVFLIGLYEVPYFKNYKIPIEGEIKWLEEKYQYVLYDGLHIYRCLPAGTKGTEFSRWGTPQEISLQERKEREERREQIALLNQPPKRGFWYRMFA